MAGHLSLTQDLRHLFQNAQTGCVIVSLLVSGSFFQLNTDLLKLLLAFLLNLRQELICPALQVLQSQVRLVTHDCR